MIIGHAADLHLGFARYGKLTADGVNQREADVAAAWRATVDGMIAADVQLCLLAGDIFDHARPSNHADHDAAEGLVRLRKAGITVVEISGNHDQPTLGGGSPLALHSQLGVKVVLRAERVSLPALKCHVLCVPETDVARVAMEPSAAAGLHLLLAHGRFNASLYKLPEAECLSPESISADFRYAALGDFHVASQVAPNAYYSGALEAVSTNPWGEIGTSYGWNEFDTDAGALTRHAVPTRPHIDLPAFSAAGLTAKELTVTVLERLAAVDLSGAVVRLVIHDMPRGVRAAMDPRPIRKAAAECLHFQLDERRPTINQVGRMVSMAALISPSDDDQPDWIDAMEAEDVPLPDVPDHDCDRRVAMLEAAAERGDLETLYQLSKDLDPYHLNEQPRVSAAA